MNSKLNINPESTQWLSIEDSYVARYFKNLKFKSIKNILSLKIFDLMNINQINPICAEEIITCLYKYLNPNIEVDKAIYEKTMSQYFDYSAWRKIHKNLSKITVSDLVLTDDINLRAIQHFYDSIRKSFFKSSEYSTREYKYRDYLDYCMQNDITAEDNNE